MQQKVSNLQICKSSLTFCIIMCIFRFYLSAWLMKAWTLVPGCYLIVKDFVVKLINLSQCNAPNKLLGLVCAWFLFNNFQKIVLLLPSVLWRCWLGGRKGIRPVKKQSGGVLVWLSVWSEVQTCIWPSWCHCQSLPLAPVNSRLVLPIWYRLTQVVLEKRPLNGCMVVVLHLFGLVNSSLPNLH